MSTGPQGLGIPTGQRDPVTQAINDLRAAVVTVPSTRQRVGDSIQLTGQTANISTTNLMTRARNGIYRVLAVLQCTTADVTAGTITLTIGWTDRVGATTTTLAQLLTAVGRNEGDHTLQIAADTNITYALAVTGIYGTAAYAVEIKLERVA